MSDLLHHFVDVRVEMTDTEFEDECIRGMCVLNAQLLQKIRGLGEREVAREVITVDEEPVDVQEVELDDNETLTAEVELLPYELRDIRSENQRAYYFETIDALIEEFTLTTPSTEYYVHGDIRGYSSGDNLNPDISRYEKTTNLISLLSDLSDFQDSASGVKRFIFFEDSKSDILIKYTGDDLCDLEELNDLENELKREGEGETRREVFRRTLVDYLAGTPPKDRFREIMNSFSSIYQKYRKGHQRYIREFSYEKLKSSFVEDRAKYIQKLHDIVNDIQNKLISIPLALLLVGGQLQPDTPFSAENLAIIFGALVLTIMLSLIINNQKIVLSDVKEEIDELRNSYLKEEPSPPKVIREGFERLNYTHDKQLSVLRIFDLLVWVFMATTLFLLIFYKLKVEAVNLYTEISILAWISSLLVISLCFKLHKSLAFMFGSSKYLGDDE